MLTDDQRVLLEDKYVLWVRASETGPVDLRDYNRRAADALRTALAICSAGLPTLADGWEWVACPISERRAAALASQTEIQYADLARDLYDAEAQLSALRAEYERLREALLAVRDWDMLLDCMPDGLATRVREALAAG